MTEKEQAKTEENVHTKDDLRKRIEDAFSKVATTKDGRSRAYAFMMYDESMSNDWKEIITNTHVPTAVSYHNKDTNPDGELKKPHYHVLMTFDSKKSVQQIVDMLTDLCNDVGGVPSPETVGSVRGYARYLLHMDNPEKYQYDRSALTLLNGFDFDSVIAREDDDYKVLCKIYSYIDDNNIIYTSQLMRDLKDYDFEMFKVAVRKMYAVVAYIKSYTYEQTSADYRNKYPNKKTTGKNLNEMLTEGLMPSVKELTERSDNNPFSPNYRKL